MTPGIPAAVKRLSVIPFFPADEDARLEIMRVIAAMIGTKLLYGSTPQQRLDWLVNAAVNVMRRWAGIPELRGIYCTRWEAADGINAYSSLPGYSAEDSESRAIDEGRRFKAIENGRLQPKLLEAAECDRMPAAELEEFHQNTIGKLIESTTFPWLRPKQQTLSAVSLAAAERELAQAPRHYLSDAEKARRMAELKSSLLGMW